MPILRMRKLSLGTTQSLPASTEFTLVMATPQPEFLTPVVWCAGLLGRGCRAPSPSRGLSSLWLTTNHMPLWEDYTSSAVSAMFMLPFLQGLSLPSQGCWQNCLL